MKMTSNKFGFPLKEYYLNFFMTSHLDSHRTTDIKQEMLSGVRTGNSTPYDKYNICGIAHVCKNRKDNIFMQRRLLQSFTYILEWGWGTCTLTKHTRHWTYSALLHFFLKIVAWHDIFNCTKFSNVNFFRIQKKIYTL